MCKSDRRSCKVNSNFVSNFLLKVNVLARTVLDSVIRDVAVARKDAQYKLELTESAAAMARAAEAAEEGDEGTC